MCSLHLIEIDVLKATGRYLHFYPKDASAFTTITNGSPTKLLLSSSIKRRGWNTVLYLILISHFLLWEEQETICCLLTFMVLLASLHEPINLTRLRKLLHGLFYYKTGIGINYSQLKILNNLKEERTRQRRMIEFLRFIHNQSKP